MKRIKAVCIVALLVALGAVPLAIPGRAEEAPTRTVTCYVVGHDHMAKSENEISMEKAEELLAHVEQAVQVYHGFNKDAQDLTEEETRQAEKILNALFAELREAGLISDGVTPQSLGLIPNFGMAILNPILSFGRGCSYIPLYPGEAFLGVLLRPIFIQYFLLGYTGVFNVVVAPPRIEYWDWVGTQTLMVFGFMGLYIDFASIGVGIPHMQVLLGESLFTAGIDWPL